MAAAPFTRKSKFKHVFGTPCKKDACYDALRISKTALDCKLCAVNPKFVAVITDSAGGGSFIVLPLSKTGRVDVNAPLVVGHSMDVLDIAWSPHNDNMIASSSADATVKIWDIPDTGLTEMMTNPLLSLEFHQQRVTSIAWHPTASNVLLSTGSDNIIVCWNLDSGCSMYEKSFPDSVSSMSFNEDGSLFACTCKDRKLRIVDSHTGEFLQEVEPHEGNKPQQCVFLKNNRLFTTGFSKMSERQFGLWSLNENGIEELNRQELDTANGVIFIAYDPDTSMVYLIGKGDNCIRYYEVVDEKPFVHWITNYTSKEPQKGFGFMPKRGVDTTKNEIARIYRIVSKATGGLCEVTQFTVPRESESFQDDLYPDTASEEPAITAVEFENGKNALPKLVSMKSQYTKSVAEKTEPKNAVEKPKSDNKSSDQSSAAAGDAASITSEEPQTSFDLDGLNREVEKLKKVIEVQALAIESLTRRMDQFEHSKN